MKQSNEKIFGCELLTYDQQDQKNNEQQEKNVVFAKVMDNSKQLTLPDLLPNSRPMRTSRNLHAIILHTVFLGISKVLEKIPPALILFTKESSGI